MSVPGPRWTAELIETPRLRLEPLRVEHADEMAPILNDRALHEYVGGQPETLKQLRARYARQVTGQSADGAQDWFNWIIRHRETAAAVGTVQATLHTQAAQTSAEIAWVIATAHQRRGYAKEAASAMVRWLRQRDVALFIAYVHPRHQASIRIAEHLGLRSTGVIKQGEIKWTSSAARVGAFPLAALPIPTSAGDPGVKLAP